MSEVAVVKAPGGSPDACGVYWGAVVQRFRQADCNTPFSDVAGSTGYLVFLS